MSLTTFFYEPFSEPEFTTFSDFNRLFDAQVKHLNRHEHRREDSLTPVLRPRVDIHESIENGGMTATFELPGLKKEDVSIDIRGHQLVVSGQSSISKELDEGGYALRERRYGKFSRTLPLPKGIKAEDIKASMESGVLTIRYPKSYPDQEPKKITIS